MRGRIDAVFADEDGGATVVDWKTGDPPDTPEASRLAAVQLAVYRLAWAALKGCPVEKVRAAFHYVRTGQTVTPARCLAPTTWPLYLRRAVGVAKDLERRCDHRNLQRQPRDRRDPHR